MIDLRGTGHEQLRYLRVVLRELMGDCQIEWKLSQSERVVRVQDKERHMGSQVDLASNEHRRLRRGSLRTYPGTGV